MISQFDITQNIREYFNITPFQDIMPWIEANINMADDVSSERDKPDFRHVSVSG